MPFVSSRVLSGKLKASATRWQQVVNSAWNNKIEPSALGSPERFVEWLDQHDCHLVFTSSGRGSAAFAEGASPHRSTTVPRILTAEQFRKEFPGYDGHFIAW